MSTIGWHPQGPAYDGPEPLLPLLSKLANLAPKCPALQLLMTMACGPCSPFPAYRSLLQYQNGCSRARSLIAVSSATARVIPSPANADLVSILHVRFMATMWGVKPL